MARVRSEEWQKRAMLAEKHKEEMAERYHNEIRYEVINSMVYGEPNRIPERISGNGAEQIFDRIDSVSAVFKYNDGEKTAILNFADYKKAGGLFLDGANAQEEALCHASTLYNVLSDDMLSDYYKYNQENLNRGLYKDRAIFSPDIVFEKGNDNAVCSVITCAAPNASVVMRRNLATKAENYETLKNRIEFIRDIAEENEIVRLKEINLIE